MKRLPSLILLLLAHQLASAEPPLGRLFLTPQQRQQIDRERESAAGRLRSVAIDGEIRRENQLRLHWSRETREWRTAHTAPAAPVGDAYDPGTASRQPLIGDGRIRIRLQEARP